MAVVVSGFSNKVPVTNDLEIPVQYSIPYIHIPTNIFNSDTNNNRSMPKGQPQGYQCSVSIS